MILWLRARRAGWLAAAALALVALDRTAGELSLSVPALFGTTSGVVFLDTFLPLIWAAAIADAFTGRGLGTEARPALLARLPASRLGVHDAGLFLTASAAAGGLVAGVAGGGVHGLAAVLVLAGLTCAGTLRAGPAAGIFASTLMALLTSVYPRNAPAARFVHLLQPDGEAAWALGCGIATCLVAAGLLVTGRVHVRLHATDVGAL
ncbi:hypothetical protein ACFJIY_11575 [Pimelobacter simplex]|uniref:hypothetical protein n=1 Tax=Nocardioides simplex TaxID=2045 RepID=UPI00367022AC